MILWLSWVRVWGWANYRFFCNALFFHLACPFVSQVISFIYNVRVSVFNETSHSFLCGVVCEHLLPCRVALPFADDTQLHDSCCPDQIDTSVQGMQDCISDVKTWMTSNKLKLNDDKTECLLIVSNRTSLPNPHPTSIHIGDTDILFSLHCCRQKIWA